MKIITFSLFSLNIILYGNSLPIEDQTLLDATSKLQENQLLYDSLDKADSNNFHDLSWVNEDENDTALLNLNGGTPFDISKHVGLYLFVKENPDSVYLLDLENSKDAPINYNHTTKILIHGFRSNGNNSISLDAKDIFMANGNHNVIIVDYEKYAYLLYPHAVIKGRKVGAYIGQVMTSLFKHNKIRLEDIHIFGVSLGAHVTGFVGKTVHAQLNRKVGRITGLDPAGPLFEIPVLAADNKRLHKDDAIFTDIIHTGGGSLGFRQSLGHADFFPNGGLPRQPGCEGEIFPFICSHIMACVLYNESITSDDFLATPCSSWKDFIGGKCDGSGRISMGHHLDTSKASGNYYLYTNKVSPRALG